MQNLASIQPESFEVFRPGLSGAKVCASRRSRRELSNEYLLAKIRFDTAENGPLQVSQQLAKKLERKHELKSHWASVPGDARPGAGVQLRGAKSQIPKKRFNFPPQTIRPVLKDKRPMATHADKLQQRCYLYVEQDHFAFEMKVDDKYEKQRSRMPAVRSAPYSGPPTPRLPTPQLSLVAHPAPELPAPAREDFLLSSQPESLAVLLRGSSPEGVQFCKDSGRAAGPRVEDGGGQMARMSELQRGAEHGNYVPATVSGHLHPLLTCFTVGQRLPAPAAPLVLPRNGRRLEQNFKDLYCVRNIDKATNNRFLYEILDGSYVTWSVTTTPDLFIVDRAQQRNGKFKEVVAQAQRLVLGYALSEGNGASCDAYQCALQGVLAGGLAEILRDAQRARGPFDPCGDFGTLCLMLPREWATLSHTSDTQAGVSCRVYFFKLDQHGAIIARPSPACFLREAFAFADAYLKGAAPFQ